jgi:hypothetical protein
MIRKIFLIVPMLLFSAGPVAADSATMANRLLTISYGDVSTDFEDTGTDASGWRVNLSYETGKKGGSVLHGVVLGYIETTADVTTVGPQTTHYKLKSLPIYYAPKFLFGKKAFKGFLKGALGMHLSEYERSGALGEVSTTDSGFYGGASLGAMLYFNEKVFANIEYEWAYLSNSYYRDGEVTSAMIGLGMRF